MTVLRRLFNTLLAIVSLKLIVSWDHAPTRTLIQWKRWTGQSKLYKVRSRLSWTVSLSRGPGAGYTYRWWNVRNKGPGDSQAQGKCGHAWPYHCNSGYCTSPWCNAQRWPVFGALLVLGVTLNLSWNARGENGSYRGFRMALNNVAGKAPMVKGSGCWKSVAFYGRRDSVYKPYILREK